MIKSNSSVQDKECDLESDFHAPESLSLYEISFELTKYLFNQEIKFFIFEYLFQAKRELFKQL